MSSLCLRYVRLFLQNNAIFVVMLNESGKRSSRTGRVDADRIVKEQLEGGGVPGRRDFIGGGRTETPRPVIGKPSLGALTEIPRIIASGVSRLARSAS